MDIYTYVNMHTLHMCICTCKYVSTYVFEKFNYSYLFLNKSEKYILNKNSKVKLIFTYIKNSKQIGMQ